MTRILRSALHYRHRASCIGDATMRTEHQGYSLIELLCVLTLIVTLAGMAIPTMQTLLQRVHRNEARLALLQIHTAQERRYAQRLRYAITLEQADDTGLDLAPRSEHHRYDLQLHTSADAQTYRAEARPVHGGTQARDGACTLLWIDELGRRGSEPTAGTDCWR